MTDSITLIRPDDWHIHLRDGAALANTVADAARSFGRVIVMPNLVPPVSNAEQAVAYRQRIEQHIPAGSSFTPLMVLYLTDNTSAEQIRAARAAGVVACKLYPAGATTNSDSGVTDLKNIYPALQAMQEEGMLFLIHGEVTDADIDIFDREQVFIERHLVPLAADFPQLKMVLEHITTADAVDFVSAAGPNIAATITAHHLLFNRNHMLVGGIRPHYYCLPILKRSRHQQRLIEAATSGNPRFFLGTDSAPHTRSRKEAACGCAGAYTAYHALELYTQAFDQAGALPQLENFASVFGADFYGLPRNTDTVTLEKIDWQLPSQLPLGDDYVCPLLAGETLPWKLLGADS
ncbi:MAG: dihydroorotase [Gammaproteobacteria bacterium]|uniref:dihydroorotase n=1 Tax=Pseudomaricurvus alcaniphilus TaxID=1166482 RepID=UPI00140ADE5A|nr:dihydroorotase [Pseudomaricurvus alcaniphilus]MBR9908919.1 dihydroorotase [Gammaproteobacteria bacterium]NHN37972.1 dihydroorotase [Pseudomaricurvus alcaniphilus]